MEEDKEERSMEKLVQDNPPATAASLFTDDLILEILSRLPARSVCRFKCVSMPWRDLIADPVHRKKLAQTLAGFIYTTYEHLGDKWSHQFASVSGIAAPFDPSLPFMQPKYKHISYVDTCNGLLLCACKENPVANEEEVRYVVYNPATQRWIELPPQPQAGADRFYCASRLAFDPKVSPHFHVLEFDETFLDDGSYVTGVDIFSSQTGAWIQRDSQLVEEFTVLDDHLRSVFLGGMLCQVGNLNTGSIYNEPALLVVDMDGKVWKTILLPDGSSSHDTIGLSQGCLYHASTTQAYINSSNKKNAVLATKITLWCLENYDSKEWVLKHSVSIDQPLGIAGRWWRVFAIHPDCDIVFMDGGDNMLATYDMQHQKFVHILNLEKGYRKYLPYVPLFSEALADACGQ